MSKLTGAIILLFICTSCCHACMKRDSTRTFKVSPSRVTIKATDSFECEGCQLIIGAMEDWLLDNVTMTTIEKYLDWLCYLLPVYNTTCEQIVNYSVPTIIKFIKEFENPHVVCSQLGMCTKPRVIFGNPFFI